MSPMFFILMRILFPFDKVARIRELMRHLIRLTISWVSDPEDVESFAYWDEDRAWLEGHIAALEYAMRCLVWAAPASCWASPTFPTAANAIRTSAIRRA